MARFRSGVLFGDEVTEVFDCALREEFALPAVNVIGTNSINATMESAREMRAPIIIQLSNSGASFFSGKGLDNSEQEASILGAVSAARHVHLLAKAYKVSVILTTDHCAAKLLPWIDGLIEHGIRFFEQEGRPLYSGHMLDLSEESLEENLDICVKYFKRMSEINMYLEMELGVTGGEEDGVDNTGVESSKLYTQPSDVAYAYKKLSAIDQKFMIAASFGNVHGVYKPGNVRLEPKILKNSQEHLRQELSIDNEKPIKFVFHGGSGSSREEIREAISYGAIKMNIDTDLQWAFWDGVRHYYKDKEAYLQGQIGNPEGADRPNKKQYDPRVWLREGEKYFIKRLRVALEDLNTIGKNE
ncbi:MAG TPA: class II fructose-bisphosphate aldolase [Oligoflexia bacterium]|nr:class II fructose-bisphosphate aldolase [Oligoflexia bacterium]HMP47841.1 class II fructose-bisphosphate aldolase [Oligoflexia bacterium]